MGSECSSTPPIRPPLRAGAAGPTVDEKRPHTPHAVTTCSFYLQEGPRGSSSCTPALMTAAFHPEQELAASWTATLRTRAMLATLGCRGRGTTAGARNTFGRAARGNCSCWHAILFLFGGSKKTTTAPEHWGVAALRAVASR